jgi:hypothetical protein
MEVSLTRHLPGTGGRPPVTATDCAQTCSQESSSISATSTAERSQQRLDRVAGIVSSGTRPWWSSTCPSPSRTRITNHLPESLRDCGPSPLRPGRATRRAPHAGGHGVVEIAGTQPSRSKRRWRRTTFGPAKAPVPARGGRVAQLHLASFLSPRRAWLSLPPLGADPARRLWGGTLRRDDPFGGVRAQNVPDFPELPSAERRNQSVTLGRRCSAVSLVQSRQTRPCIDAG